MHCGHAVKRLKSSWAAQSRSVASCWTPSCHRSKLTIVCGSSSSSRSSSSSSSQIYVCVYMDAGSGCSSISPLRSQWIDIYDISILEGPADVCPIISAWA